MSLLLLLQSGPVVASPVITSPADDPHAFSVIEGVTSIIFITYTGDTGTVAFSGPHAATFDYVDAQSPVEIVTTSAIPIEVGSYDFTVTIENGSGADSVRLLLTVTSGAASPWGAIRGTIRGCIVGLGDSDEEEEDAWL